MEISKKKTRTAFREPTKTKLIDAWYRKRLTQISKHVALIVKEYKGEENPAVMSQWIQQRLFSYSFEIEQWAYAVSKTMLDRVSKADYDTWLKVGQKVGLETRKKLKAVEPIYKRLQAEQVRLITSLPIDSAKKVQEWVTEGLDKGQRYSEIVDRIQSKLADENRNHAILIARTETARCRSHFTEARARNVGSTHYVWRTVGDGTVRELHRKNNGQIFAWTDPPIAGVGRGGQPVLAHAGCIYNCRCWAEPIFPDDEG